MNDYYERFEMALVAEMRGSSAPARLPGDVSRCGRSGASSGGWAQAALIAEILANQPISGLTLDDRSHRRLLPGRLFLQIEHHGIPDVGLPYGEDQSAPFAVVETPRPPDGHTKTLRE